MNNNAHDSVGGQPTCANTIKLTSIAKACGYASIKSTSNLNEIEGHIKKIKNEPGPHFFEVKVKKDIILFDQNKDLLEQENKVISVDGVNGSEIILGSMTEVSINGNWPSIFDAKKDQ